MDLETLARLEEKEKMEETPFKKDGSGVGLLGPVKMPRNMEGGKSPKKIANCPPDISSYFFFFLVNGS